MSPTCCYVLTWLHSVCGQSGDKDSPLIPANWNPKQQGGQKVSNEAAQQYNTYSAKQWRIRQYLNTPPILPGTCLQVLFITAACKCARKRW